MTASNWPMLPIASGLARAPSGKIESPAQCSSLASHYWDLVECHSMAAVLLNQFHYKRMFTKWQKTSCRFDCKRWHVLIAADRRGLLAPVHAQGGFQGVFHFLIFCPCLYL